VAPALDQLQRPLRDLRISVTDRCNFRCRYCMPREVFGRDYEFLPKADILTFEELERLARVFAQLGVEKIRLTGGEPLLRRNLDRLIENLAAIPQISDLTLTTNGSLLAEMAVKLRSAGLKRLTVSLDSLDDVTFRRMADADFPVSRVIAGIEAAVESGFSPVKINMVVQRGVNEQEIPAIARRFSGPEFILRFIEYMDVGNTNGWRMSDVVPESEILERIAEPMTPIAPNYTGETARRYRTASGGEIGVIASVTKPFCRGCTRARLAADGRLYTCLFASEGHDLRALVRSVDDDALKAAVAAIWMGRSDRYSELRSAETVAQRKAEMSLLGG
jgi:cyclic pyranopterin phosphate synthase